MCCTTAVAPRGGATAPRARVQGGARRPGAL